MDSEQSEQLSVRRCYWAKSETTGASQITINWLDLSRKRIHTLAQDSPLTKSAAEDQVPYDGETRGIACWRIGKRPAGCALLSGGSLQTCHHTTKTTMNGSIDIGP